MSFQAGCCLLTDWLPPPGPPSSPTDSTQLSHSVQHHANLDSYQLKSCRASRRSSRFSSRPKSGLPTDVLCLLLLTLCTAAQLSSAQKQLHTPLARL